MRAKQARHIVNKVIPGILASSSRARRGAEGSELIANSEPRSNCSGKTEKDGADARDDVAYVKRKGQGRRKAKAVVEEDEIIVRAGHEKKKKERGKARQRKDSLEEPFASPSLDSASHHDRSAPDRTVRIIATDTLTTARMLLSESKPSRKQSNVCILNMASSLRPGGGVLSGATSQEEFLCSRTTLLSSLQESFYRLPEYGGIYTHDVMVFRNGLPLGDPKGELGSGERWWVDCISAGMLRFPDLEGGEEEEKRLSKKDRKVVEAKMRAVLRIACTKGIKKIVLGAWGCGAYGNPVPDIAEAWYDVLNGKSSHSGMKGKHNKPIETWDEIKEVVFAISNVKMATEFSSAFGGCKTVEAGPGGSTEEEDEEGTDTVVQELRIKIQEMEGQLQKVWNPDLKLRMGVILGGLRKQLREREGVPGRDHQEDEGRGSGTDDDSSAEEGNEDTHEKSEENLTDEEGVSSDENGSMPGGLTLA